MEKHQMLNIINAHAGEWLTLCDLDNFILSLDKSLVSVFEHTGAVDILADNSMSYGLGDTDNVPEWLNVEFDIVKRESKDELATIVSIKGAEIL